MKVAEAAYFILIAFSRVDENSDSEAKEKAIAGEAVDSLFPKNSIDKASLEAKLSEHSEDELTRLFEDSMAILSRQNLDLKRNLLKYINQIILADNSISNSEQMLLTIVCQGWNIPVSEIQ